MIAQVKIEEWFQLALASAANGLQAACLGDEKGRPVTDPDRIGELLAAGVKHGSGRFYGVTQTMGDIGDLPGGTIWICMTGNNEGDLQNAQFYVHAREAVLALINERAALIAKLKAAGIEP